MGERGRGVSRDGRHAPLVRAAARLVVMALLAAILAVAGAGTSPGVASAETLPAAPTGVVATADVLRAQLSWTAPAGPVAGYEITVSPGGRKLSVPMATTSWWVDGIPAGTTATFTVRARNAQGDGPSSLESAPVTIRAVGGAYHPLAAPVRLLDTRDGTGAPQARVRGGQTLALQISGRSGIPATGVAGVVLNLTVVNASEATHVTAWPAGLPKPDSSNVNVDSGRAAPNLVEVGVGASGQVSLFNNSGTVDLIADVAGWLGDPTAPPNSDGAYSPLAPARLLDTRDGTGGAGTQPVGAGEAITLTVAGHGGVPATGVEAVVLNLTATGPSQDTHVTVWPAGQSLPGVSNLNLVAGETRPNRVVVRLGAGGAVSLRNNAGHVHIIVDVSGWYSDATATKPAATFTGVAPHRVVDTRDGTGVPAGRLDTGTVLTVPIAGTSGVPAPTDHVPATAVVANVTVTGASNDSHLTIWPADRPKAGSSDLNFTAGEVIPNLVVVKLSGDGKISLANNEGATNVIVDVLGYYSGDLVLGTGLSVLTAAQASAITAVGPTSVTFSAVPPGLAAQGLLVAPRSALTPNGLLRRIVAVTGTTVTTAGAGINDAVPAGTAQPAASPNGTVTHGTQALGGGFPFNTTLGSEVSLSGSLDVGLAFGASADVSWTGGLSMSVAATVTASASATLDVPVAADVAANVKLSPDPIFEAAGDFQAGPVPVFWVAEGWPKVIASIHAQTSLELSAHGQASGTFGVDYHDGAAHPIAGLSASGDAALSAGAEDKVTGDLAVGLDFSFKIYDLVGPEAFAGLHVTATRTTCDLKLSVRAGANFGIAFSVDIGPLSFGYSSDLFSLDGPDVELVDLPLSDCDTFANPDAYTAAIGTPLVVAAPGVLDNDIGEGRHVVAHTNPHHGTLMLGADGAFTYTPAGGFAGTDTFTYTAQGGGAESNSAETTVTLTVTVVWSGTIHVSYDIAYDICCVGVQTRNATMTIPKQLVADAGSLPWQPGALVGTSTFRPYDPDPLSRTCSGPFSSTMGFALTHDYDQRTGLNWFAMFNDNDYFTVGCSDGTNGDFNLDPSGGHNDTTGLGRCEDALEQGITADTAGADASTTSGTFTSTRDDRPGFNLVEHCTVTWQLTKLADSDGDGHPDP